MKNWSLKKLVNVAAEICDYALNHYNTGECHRPTTPWPDDSPNHTLAWEALGASSYTLACIAAQHTPGGRNGVESEAPFWALRMWEFMPSKKRRRLAKEFFQGLGAQKRNAKTPHQLVEVAISEADLALSSVDVRCQTCGIYLDGNEPDEVAAGEQCHHCSRAPLAAQKSCGTEYIVADPKGLLGNIKTLESACPKCLGPMEFEIGVSIRMDTNPEVVSIDTDGCRGTDYWWCAACGSHADPLQLDALAEARADAAAADKPHCLTQENTQREVAEIAKTYDLWVRAAAGYGAKDAENLRDAMGRAMIRRMLLALRGRRTRPRVGDKLNTLKGDNDCDENDQPRRALPGAVGKVVDVNDDRFDVLFDESRVWVVLEFHEICDPAQYVWEP